MYRIIILLLIISCGKKQDEQEVNYSMCIESCVDRNLKNVNWNKLDATSYCVNFVLPKSKCYTLNNETFYYR